MQVNSNEPIYMIPVGKADDKRLNSLGAICNSLSMQLINSNSTSKNPKILDVGCGNGNLTNLFAKTFSNSVVVGVDISAEQIDVAKAKVKEENLTNVSWDICDVYYLKDLEKKYPELFDIVHSRFVLSHLTDPAKAVDPMLSMVKPGGILIMEEMGAKRTYKEPLPKPIQAWKKLVELQHQWQQSHKDTIERIVTHLSNSDKFSYHTELFNIKVEGQQKKSMFRIGVEHGLKKLEELGQSELIKTFGYEDGKTWLEDLKKFEIDDSITLEVQNYEAIIVLKR